MSGKTYYKQRDDIIEKLEAENRKLKEELKGVKRKADRMKLDADWEARRVYWSPGGCEAYWGKGSY